ncbi:MAG: Dabb family protein [Roseococcus sp.]|nr:Dabb family protein [Roseococcus sp.]
MTAATAHRLEGLEPDNLLAFLALLGLLRALEAAGWRPRAHWEGLPLRPILTLREAKTQDQVAQAAAEGCAVLAMDHDFGGEKDLNFEGARARSLLDAAQRPDAPGRSALLGSLFSDGAVKDDGRILAAPLCAMFGQGHQHFLTRLTEVVRGVLPKAMSKRRPPPDLNAPTYLCSALFMPWSRSDETDGFRWDPAEDRRYALRFKNPSGDAGRTVHGANRLAGVGLAALPGAAVVRRRGLRFLTVGAEVGPDGAMGITWPIWSRAASLSAIQALLGHPALVSADQGSMRHLGVFERRCARRIANGKFMNFTRAEAV